MTEDYIMLPHPANMVEVKAFLKRNGYSIKKLSKYSSAIAAIDRPNGGKVSKERLVVFNHLMR